MTKNVHIPMDEDEYEELEPVKHRNRLTWKELLYKGKEKLEEDGER